MKSKVIKTITLIFIVLIITNIVCAIANKAQAISDVTEDLEFWEPNDEGTSTGLTNKVGIIVTVVRVVGMAISVGTLSVIGIKFMLGSAEEKAQYKQTLLPWVIGAILVFAMTTAPTIIYNMVSGTGTSSGSGTNAGTGGSSGQQKVHITLNASELTLKLGEYEETTINAIVAGTNKKVKWESSNTQVATVDLTGKVTAKSKGTATITAYVGKATATCKVTVEATVTTNITISKDSVVLNAPITHSYQLTATIQPSTSKEPITWSSSNSNVVTVSNDGKVRAVGAGEAIITTKSGTKTDTCKVIVNSSRIYEERYYNPSTKKVLTTRTSDEDLEFLLYIPDVSQVKNIDKLPLIVYLHGDYKPGDLKNNNPFGLQKQETNYSTVCIFPKCYASKGTYGWGSANDQLIEKLKDLIDYSKENYNVDENKIALTGHSNGAVATWNIGLKNPTMFSCLVAVCGFYSSRTEKYPDCPIAIISSSADESWKYDYTMNKIKEETGCMINVDRRNKSHNDMIKEAYTSKLINWMIEPNNSFNYK